MGAGITVAVIAAVIRPTIRPAALSGHYLGARCLDGLRWRHSHRRGCVYHLTLPCGSKLQRKPVNLAAGTAICRPRRLCSIHCGSRNLGDVHSMTSARTGTGTFVTLLPTAAPQVTTAFEDVLDIKLVTSASAAVAGIATSSCWRILSEIEKLSEQFGGGARG